MKRGLNESPSSQVAEGEKRPRVFGEVPAEEAILTLRTLIHAKDSGLLIGKQGANIKKIREISGADVKLTEPPSGSSRRAASCTGTTGQVSSAFAAMIELLHPPSPEGTPPQDITQPTFTLLVGNEVIGACIGKGGQVIAQTRTSTGCVIKVSDKPIEGSTEKSIELTGSIAACASAVDMIVKQLATMAEKDTKTVPPTKIEWGTAAAIQNYFATPPPSTPAPPSLTTPFDGFGGYGYPPSGGEQRQVVVPVATGLAGSLIGKGGGTIRRIRETSGAEVKIADPIPGAETRNVTITGNEAATHHAVSLVYAALGQPSPFGPVAPGGSPFYRYY